MEKNLKNHKFVTLVHMVTCFAVEIDQKFK